MKELDKLNIRYNFYNIKDINIEIRVDSLKKLNNYDITKEINTIINFNNYGIKEQAQKVLRNRINYVSYCKEYDILINKVKIECSKDVFSRLKLVFKKIFLKTKKKKAILDFELNILISYTSPAGRNYQERRFKYNYDDLVKIISSYNNYSNNINNSSKSVILKERNHLIECVYCKKLINLNSNNCVFCGKKQHSRSDNTNSFVNNDKNKNNLIPTFDDNFMLKKKENIKSDNLNKSINEQQKNINNVKEKDNDEGIISLYDANNNLDVSIDNIGKTEFIKENQQQLNCNYCGRLIDFNLKACNYCGMIQFGNSNCLNLDKNNIDGTINEYNADMDINDNSFQDYVNNSFINKKKHSKEVYKKNNVKDKKSNIEEYIYNHYPDCVMFEQKVKVKLDDGTYFYEEIVDSLDVKRKNTKREIALLEYYTTKYLNKNINNYNIYDIRFERNFWYADEGRSVYFDCKCNKCGRLIFQTAHNFILHPIICKCNDKKYKNLEDIDLEWDKGLFPYRKRISSFYDDNKFYDIYMEEIFNLYFNNDRGMIKRIGFSSINEYNENETYIIGNVSICINDEYITFENVYYNYYMVIPEEFNYKYLSNARKSIVFNPILYFYDDNDNYNFEILKKEGQIINKKYDSFVFIYFSKIKDSYKMNVYHNEKMIFSKQINSCFEIKKIYNNNIINPVSFRKIGYDGVVDDCFTNITDYIFSSKFDNESSISKYRFNVNDKSMYYYDLNEEIRKMETKKLIDRSKVVITINTDKIEPYLKKQIESFSVIDNNKYKRIFIHLNAYETGWVLYEYLKDKSEVIVLENEFLDDKSQNFCFLIEKENREVLDFIDYIILHSNDHKSYECNIYEHSISSICKILLEKKENVDKIINAITNEKILIFDNIMVEGIVIGKIKNNIEFRDYLTDYNILKHSYYKEIILKLKNKYCVDDFGLILIMLAKYGEDVVFDLNERCRINESKKLKFDELYKELLIKSNYKNNKWKSEYNLYLLIKTYFNDAIFQYKFKELGNQSIDIFVPSLNIAFEYQGEQHYVPGIFGKNENDFEHSKYLDERKRIICKNCNIHLIEWHFETKINKIELDYALYEIKELLIDKYEFSSIFKEK